MTRLLDQAIESVRGLSEHRQDELAEVITQATQPSVNYTPGQLAAIDEGIVQADAGQFAAEQQVSNLFARFRAA